jgi:hypothetical protein
MGNVEEAERRDLAVERAGSVFDTVKMSSRPSASKSATTTPVSTAPRVSSRKRLPHMRGSSNTFGTVTPVSFAVRMENGLLPAGGMFRGYRGLAV